MTEPLLKWPGGKRWLARRIVPYLKGSVERYIEPFLGGGAVLFALGPSKALAGDVNADLIRCYGAIKENPKAVLARLDALAASKRDYYRIRDRWFPRGPIGRAAKLIYLLHHSWNGLYRVNRWGEFNVPYCPRRRKKGLRPADVETIAEILRRTDLRCADFEEVLKEAGSGDLIFADPPYFGDSSETFSRYNAVRFSHKDQERLAMRLLDAERKGAAWVLTNGGLDQVVVHFAGYDIFAVDRPQTISGKPEARRRIFECVVLSKSAGLDDLRTYLGEGARRV